MANGKVLGQNHITQHFESNKDGKDFSCIYNQWRSWVR